MRRITLLTIATFLMMAGASAKEHSVQQAEQADTADYTKFRFSGTDEMLARFMDYGPDRFNSTTAGNTKKHRADISIPGLSLEFNYKITPKWILTAEMTFDLEGASLEHLNITRLFIPEFNVRAGYLTVPVGLTNAHDDPIDFFGPERPEAESALLPSTWLETGIEVFGSFGRRFTRFDYQLMAVAGLNAGEFTGNRWIAGGSGSIFKINNFASPGFVARLDYSGVPGFRTGVSFYYCHNAGSNADEDQDFSNIGRIPVAIGTWDAQYVNSFLSARANITYGYLGNSAALSDAAQNDFTIAKNTIGYGAEIGLNLASVTKGKCPVIYPFARYEYFNPQYRGENHQTMDRRLEVSKWSVGLNWFIFDNLVIKGAYVNRQIGTSNPFAAGPYNSKNEFQIGIAYIGTFISR